MAKMSIQEKIDKYLELLKTKDFVVEADSMRDFNTNTKIGSFFADHYKEIIDRILNDKKLNNKSYSISMMSKIVDFISTNRTRNKEDLVSNVINYLNDHKEEIFRMVSIDMSETVKFKFKDAFNHYLEVVNYDEEKSEFKLETYMNGAGKDFAESCEKAYKAIIIFMDASNSEKHSYIPKDNQELTTWRSTPDNDKFPILGSSKWRSAFGSSDSDIKSERLLLQMIQEGLLFDSRAMISESDLIVKSGHSLYALYKLLDPVSQTLINSEFYIYDTNNPFNEKKPVGMCAVLDDGFDYEKAGTPENENDFKENTDAFITARYADIDLNNITKEDLDFLKRLATALLAYCEYKFPRSKVYDKLPFDEEKQKHIETTYRSTTNLDKVSKLYLYTHFTTEEIAALDDFYQNLRLDFYDKEKFLELTIFFKNYIVNELNMYLEFNDIVFNNILKYYTCIKDFNLFNGVSDNLFLNSFFTEGTVKALQEKIEERKAKMRPKVVVPNHSKDEAPLEDIEWQEVDIPGEDNIKFTEDIKIGDKNWKEAVIKAGYVKNPEEFMQKEFAITSEDPEELDKKDEIRKKREDYIARHKQYSNNYSTKHGNKVQTDKELKNNKKFKDNKKDEDKLNDLNRIIHLKKNKDGIYIPKETYTQVLHFMDNKDNFSPKMQKQIESLYKDLAMLTSQIDYVRLHKISGANNIYKTRNNTFIIDDEEDMEEGSGKNLAYLNELSSTEKIQMIKELERDIDESREKLANSKYSKEEKGEIMDKMFYDKNKRAYLFSLLGNSEKMHKIK